MSYPALTKTVEANYDRYYAARELRIRAIITAANKLAANIRDVDANYQLMEALRAEFSDGVGFDGAYEDACMDVHKKPGEEYRPRIDLLSVWRR